ncbi:hypothetical protein [Nocardioides mangrovi]|uniref:SnoaL-like domain-containing protein n=1 Tax=Nocardioides mangrovi TaxID=2874580 RepID=A0ABS7UHJ2_9ACTN|nr:hypothetical protein [Nocardioides mangrovi]MBZ5740347.1 hypothetical protein [Nocardioides mangrovi]
MHLLLALALLLDPTPATRPEVAAADVLHAWDVRRSAAWSAGDVAGLRALYLPGSAAGRADVAMLRAWRARGLRVEGMQTQLLSVSVRSRTRERFVVDVVDRVVVGSVVPSGDALPADRPTAHTLVLRRVSGEWLVASVASAVS